MSQTDFPQETVVLLFPVWEIKPTFTGFNKPSKVNTKHLSNVIDCPITKPNSYITLIFVSTEVNGKDWFDLDM